VEGASRPVCRLLPKYKEGPSSDKVWNGDRSVLFPRKMSSLAAGFTVRHMLPEDGPAVAAVQEASYPPHYHEDVSFVINRRGVFPEGSFVIQDGTGKIVAYAQCYPWLREAALKEPPALHDGDACATIKEALAVENRSEALLFLHEVTVYEQGKGLGTFLMNKLLEVAKETGFSTAMLVAVLGNGPLWAKFGFELTKELPWGYYAEDLADGDGGAEKPVKTVLEPRPSYYSKDLSAVVMMKTIA
jgi:GNAT superfamily N-acetyltransferase